MNQVSSCLYLILRLAEVHRVSTWCERFAESLNNDNVVVEICSEDIVYDTITGKQAYTWCEVIRTNCSLNHNWNVWAVDDTSVIKLWTLITK